MSVYGVVININAFGATVRLDDGGLAPADAADVDAHRAEYERALSDGSRLPFVRGSGQRRQAITMAPQVSTDRFEEQIASYLRSTEELWENPDVPAHERHFLRKKKRAAHWEPKRKT